MSETKYLAKPKLRELLSDEKYKSLFPNQKDLALAAGVNTPTISRFDSQTRYDINTLISISKELDISVEELFTVSENPNYVKISVPRYTKKDQDSAFEFVKYLVADKKIRFDLDEDGLIINAEFDQNIPETAQEILTETLVEFSSVFDGTDKKTKSDDINGRRREIIFTNIFHKEEITEYEKNYALSNWKSYIDFVENSTIEEDKKVAKIALFIAEGQKKNK